MCKCSINRRNAIVRTLKCHKGIGLPVKGRALVAHDNFSARYDLDRIRGVFSRPQHKLYKKSYKNKILVLDQSKGGVASAWMLYEMKARNVIPKAILFNKANTILVQGAAMANLTLCDRFEEGDITKILKTGQLLEIYPALGEVRIIGEQILGDNQ